MYREIYNIPFKSINENNYKVIIEKNGFIGSTTELTGASNPFTISTELENPLYPFRLSTATLKIFGGDYLQNLFTSNPQGVRVKLLKNDSIEWLGFVTNDTYSQDYSNTEFIYEIELVNPISTLKYKKFVKTTETITFIDLIKDAINYTNSEINSIYLPTSITNELNQNIYNIISVSPYNFIDEQGEEMNYYEILEEIAKYLSLTITIDKGSVYFIDYIGINLGYNQYYRYQGSNITTVTISDTDIIQNIGYAGDGSKLSINSGKNKAKVTCSLFDIDNILPEFNDKGTTLYNKVTTGESNTTKAIIRYYNHPIYTFYYYNRKVNGKWIEEIGDRKRNNYNDLGGVFVRTTHYEKKNIPSKLPFENEIQARVRIDNDYYLTEENKLITFKSDRIFHYNRNTFFGISFSIKFTKDDEFQFSEKNATSTPLGNFNIVLKFRIGDKYWDGTNWTTNDSKFTISIPTEEGTNRLKVGKYYSVVDTNDYTLMVPNLAGYIFRSPTTGLLGDCELTIYSISNFLNGLTGIEYMYIKDFNFDYAIANEDLVYGDWEEESKNDITYENIIDGDYVEEADEVELKICTFPDNYYKLCNSTAFVNNNPLKILKYKPLDITDIPEKVIIQRTVNYYSSPKYQLSIPVNNTDLKPYTIITDSNLSDKKFIYAGNEIDYEFEKNTINMLEI